LKQVEWMRNEIAQLKRKSGKDGDSTSTNSQPLSKKQRSKPPAPKKKAKVWDYNEKAELTEKINDLLTKDESYMEIIIQTIQDYSDAKVDDDEEMELDIDNLNIDCLNRLDNFITKSFSDIRKKIKGNAQK